MPLQPSYHSEHPGIVLLQKVDEEVVAYRLVESRSPLAQDFESHYASGKRPNPTRPYNAFSWFAVSMFLDRSRVERFVERSRAQQRPAWVAAVRLAPGHGLHVALNGQTAHLDVFGFPQVLLSMVEHVDD